MLKKRLIPVVLLRNGIAVQSKGFKRYQRLGDPTTIVERLSDWASDELVYLDISRDATYDLGRDDLNRSNHHELLSILQEISKKCFMPLAFGGGIRTLEDVAARVGRGADKVILNTQALRDPGFISRCAARFGSQCVVICIDARRTGEGNWEVFADGGRTATGRSPQRWAREAAERGAGEILIQSIDQDGSGRGFDVQLIQCVVQSVAIPVIALGGAGRWEDFHAALEQGGASAVAAANIFNYMENSVFKAKRFLFDQGLDVREPRMGYSLESRAAPAA